MRELRHVFAFSRQRGKGGFARGSYIGLMCSGQIQLPPLFTDLVVQAIVCHPLSMFRMRGFGGPQSCCFAASVSPCVMAVCCLETANA